MNNSQPILEMRGICKSFGPVKALDNVDLKLQLGEIRGLLGGNGAGKTTLMNILYGLYKSDAGEIKVAGQKININSPLAAIQGGIGMVHQHFLQVNHFTVAENIVLGSKLQNRFSLNLRDEKERINELATRFGLAVDVDRVVDELPMGRRQRVEILKALYRGVKILVLDEPTTNLTPQEVDALFQSLRVMVDDGLSVIFITHKLREVLEVCDTITVLRQGRTVLTLDREHASEDAFVKGMVGDEMDVENSIIFSQNSERVTTQAGKKPILQMRNVVVGASDRPDLNNCTISIAEGEILGIAGVAGNGQLELAESILGLRDCQAGEIEFEGLLNDGSTTRHLLENGVAYIPEDRWLDGFLPTANVAQNLILGRHRSQPYSDGRFLNWRTIYAKARELIQEFNIKAQGPGDTAGNLSGGNIQRVMLARAFSHPIRLLIAHNPTRGLDIVSMESIYAEILERRQQGMATLLISENMDELFLLSDRIVALCNGEVMGVLGREAFDKYELGRMMSGSKQSE